MKHEHPDKYTQALVTTRFSRRQVLQGLAAVTALATLPSLPSRRALGQTTGGLTGTVPASSAADAGYIDAFRNGYQGNDEVKQFLALRRQIEYARKNPSASYDRIVGAGDEFRQEYESKAIRGETPAYLESRKTVDRYSIGIDAFGALPGAGPLAKEAWDRFVKAPIEKQWEPINRFEASKKQQEYFLEVKGHEQEIGTEALALCRTKPEFAKAMDMDHQATTGVSCKDVVANNSSALLEPTLSKMKPATQQRIRAAIQPDGSCSITEDEMRAIMREELGGLATNMDDMLGLVKSIDAQQREILGWINDETKRREAQEALQAKAAAHQLAIDGANSAVYLVSTFLGFLGPEGKKLGNEVMVVGSAAIQVYDSITKFAESVGQIGEFAQLANSLFSFSGAIMTGNIVGAVMNVVGLFAEQGPDPDQMILDELGKLQEQVGKMYTQMHERFDRVEKVLNAIYDGINGIFTLLDAKFTQMQNDIDTLIRDADLIQQELARQEMQLNRLETSVHEGLQDGFRQPLIEGINQAMGYNDRVPAGMSAQDFDTFFNKFYTWALEFAHEENEQPVAARLYTDDEVLAELEGYALEENIQYLSNWLQQRAALPALSSGPLPNPTTWGICAEATALLQTENPKYALTATYPSRFAAIQQEGENLLSALRRITVKNTTTGPQPNIELFKFLIDTYKTKVVELDDALKAIELQQLTTPPMNWSKINPWGRAQQKIDHAPEVPSNAPSNILSFIPAFYLLADYMKLDDPALSTGVVPGWGEERWEPSEPDGVGTFYEYAKLKVTVTVRYGGTPIVTRHIVGDDELLVRIVTEDKDGHISQSVLVTKQTAFDQRWAQGQNLKARFEAGASQESSPTVTLSGLVDRLEAKLRERRIAITQKINQELGEGQTLSADTRRRLGGAKALIDRFVNLGMPIAIETDEFLRTMLYGGSSQTEDGQPVLAQSLVDLPQVRERYYVAYQEATATPDPNYPVDKDFVNVRLPLRKDADDRADALYKPGPDPKNPHQGATGVLAGYLTSIAAGTRHEGLPAIQSVLLKSRAASVVVKALNQDTLPPKVSIVTPANNATGVKRNANLTATFSEKMDPLSITKSTFKLFKVNADGSTTQITNVTVTRSTDGLKATLNPFGSSTTLLAKSTKYKAIVTTGAKDVAGNPLDQNSTTTGNQQMAWSFKTGLL